MADKRKPGLGGDASPLGTRSKTPYKPDASSLVTFALSKQLQQAFNPFAVDVDKTKVIDVSQLPEFFKAAAIKYQEAEIERITQQVEHEYDIGCRENATKLSFDNVVELLCSPNYSLCLQLEEMISKDRRDMIKNYIKTVLGDDDVARSKAIAGPPTQLLGDKQAVRKVALEMHNQQNSEQTRIYLVRALANLGEKPREVSGAQPPEDQRRNMMWDAKAIAACLLPLTLGHEYYLDKRSFYNPEPRGGDNSMNPPIGVGLTQAALDYRKRAQELHRTLEFHDEVPTDYCARPEYYVPFKKALYEHSEAVRVECVLAAATLGNHEMEIILKVLLNSATHDPSWAVRAAAVEKLGDFAREIRKLGFKTRWGEQRFWFPDEYSPWRDSRADVRSHFWSVLQNATQDLAWQVRKRACETCADALEFGDRVPYSWIVVCAEDGAATVKSTALKLLMNALFGRGLLISERNYNLVNNLQEGLSPEEAVSAADHDAMASGKDNDWERAVVDALLDRTQHATALVRRQALQTLADTTCNARLRGDNKAILCFIQALQDSDMLVQTAAVQSLRKVALKGDLRVTHALTETALLHEDVLTRKVAIEALEVLAVLGDSHVVTVLQELSQDKHAWVREAALKALEIIAKEADEQSVNAATRNLQDKSWEVRRTAAKTLMALEPEGDAQDTVAPKVFGKEDKAWFKNVEGFLRKPLFMPLR